jgi:acetolactate synthase-1/2/3 large subunit
MIRTNDNEPLVLKPECYGSDLIVDLLRAYGIEYVAFNPGSSFRGIHDSIVNYGKGDTPRIIECTHEEIAVSIAHGYAKVTSKPMVVICHDGVGLMHASMAIYNAYADGVPIIILGGTGPVDPSFRRPWIDWIHTGLIQGDLVRQIVKWDDQPPSHASIIQSFARAYILSMCEPRGPVYLCYDARLQENRLGDEIEIPHPTRYPLPTPLHGDPATLWDIARLLLYSEKPLIIAGTVGRNWESTRYLLELAELTSTPVIDTLQRFNFPNNNSLDVTGTNFPELADFILSLDVKSIAGGLNHCRIRLGLTDQERYTNLRNDVKIAEINLHNLALKSLMNDFEDLQASDIHMLADTSQALPVLIQKCKEILTKDHRLNEMLKERFVASKQVHDEARKNWLEQSKINWNASPITPARLAHEIWLCVSDTDWALAQGTLEGWARKLWIWTKPQHYHGDSGGGGIGYGLGASIGIALAYKDSPILVLALLGDGEILMTCSSFWIASHYRIPLLVVVNNNRAYMNDTIHQIAIASRRNRDLTKARIGTELSDPAPNFGKLAESFSCVGEGPIEHPEELHAVLSRAVEMVTEQKQLVLVDVVTRNL